MSRGREGPPRAARSRLTLYRTSLCISRAALCCSCTLASRLRVVVVGSVLRILSECSPSPQQAQRSLGHVTSCLSPRHCLLVGGGRRRWVLRGTLTALREASASSPSSKGKPGLQQEAEAGLQAVSKSEDVGIFSAAARTSHPKSQGPTFSQTGHWPYQSRFARFENSAFSGTLLSV